MPLLIDESNYGDAIAEHDDRRNFQEGLADPECHPRRLAYGSIPGVARATDHFDPIPRTEWPKMIESGRGAFLHDLIKDHLPPHDQGKTNYCTFHGTVRAMETMRVWQGQIPIILSAESLAVPVTGGVNRGAAIDEAIIQAKSFGPCPQEYWPLNDRNENHAAKGWDTIREQFRLIQWLDVHGFDMQMTFALLRIPVIIGLGWWGHCICQLDPVMFEDGTFGIGADNSWGADYGDRGYFQLTEQRGTADLGAVAPLCVKSEGGFDPEAYTSPSKPQAT
jgi:hypothetical protein